MKKQFLRRFMSRLLLALVTCSYSAAFGQDMGTVVFYNMDVFGLNAPDYLCDSSTRLFGPQFIAEMMAGPTPTNLISVAQATFTVILHNRQPPLPLPGYYLGPEAVLGYCGMAYIQVNIWNTNTGPTFEAARASGLTKWAQSAIFTISPLGGYCCEPPCIPAAPYGLTSLRLNGPYSPPPIGITLISTNTIQLDWPYGLGNYGVQQSHDLQSNSWSFLTNIPTVYASSNLVTIPNPTNTTFFRLVAQ
jgi:hypothetical protein